MDIKIKKITPMFNSIVTTMEVYEGEVTTESGLIDGQKTSGGLKEYQRVVSVGSMVKGLKEGDFVCINPARYAVKKHKEGSMKDGVISDNPVLTYNFNVINLDGVNHLLLSDSDVSFVIEEYEIEQPKEVMLIQSDNTIN